MSTPLIAPEHSPKAITIGMISCELMPAGTSTAAISTVMNPASGPTDRSMPPLPDRIGKVTAIAVSTVGHSTAMDAAQLCWDRNCGWTIALAMNSTTSSDTGTTRELLRCASCRTAGADRAGGRTWRGSTLAIGACLAGPWLPGAGLMLVAEHRGHDVGVRRRLGWQHRYDTCFVEHRDLVV